MDACSRNDYTSVVGKPRFDPEQLDDHDPFEIDTQAVHLFKHPHLGIDEVLDVWNSDPVLPSQPTRALADVRRSRRTSARRPNRPVEDRQAAQMPTHRLLRGLPTTGQPIQERPMTNTDMTPDEEYDYYARPENQVPQGPPVRRRARMSDPIPVRLPPELLERVRRAAEDDDRSISAWIRRAVEHELAN